MSAAVATRPRPASPPAGPTSSPATDYARGVVAGDIVAGPYVRLACERHLRDLERQGTKGFPYVFSHEREDRFYRFARFVNLADDMPFVLEPFQQFIVGSLMGWIHEKTGYRRFRTAYVEIGKGNGKTPLVSLILLYGLMADGEKLPELYSAAVTRDQAGIGYRDMVNMIDASPMLKSRLVVEVNNIAYGAGFYRTVSSEGRSLDGPRPHMAGIDELHEHRTPIVVNKIRAGRKRRRQPLILEITNSGYSRESICWEHHELSLKVVEQTVFDETWFAYVCALDEGDDWHDPTVWVKTNPGLGTILPIEYLEEQVKEADQILRARSMIMRLNFCIWTDSASRWLDVAIWEALARDLTLEDFRGREAYAALDLSTTTDLTALVLLFPLDAELAAQLGAIDADLLDELEAAAGDDDELHARAPAYAVIPMFWAPEATIEKRTNEDGVPYRAWCEDGWLEATEGNIVDYDAVQARLAQVVDDFEIRILEVAYDRWNATQLVTNLRKDGLECVPVGQGYISMSAPSKEFERLLLGERLVQDGNPVMRWMVANVVVEQDPAGNIKPSKQKSTERIDGVPALVMDIGRAMAPPEEGKAKPAPPVFYGRRRLEEIRAAAAAAKGGSE